jgi:hypothetical protein
MSMTVEPECGAVFGILDVKKGEEFVGLFKLPGSEAGDRTPFDVGVVVEFGMIKLVSPVGR